MTTITIEQAYEKGWIAAAKWANRHDLVSDIGSAAYANDLRSAISAPATAPEQCWCDEQGIGEPGVSCGDCPTRDYKTTAPEQPSWQDAPDAPGIWMSSLNDAARRLDEFDVEHMAKNPWPNRRWFGPIPEDKP